MDTRDTLFRHKVPIQIRFNDIDILGHVNNAVHQYYFDYARIQYFKEVFKNEMDWKKQSLVLVNITVDYLNPIEINDKIEVLSKIHHIGNKSIGMTQHILCTATGEIKSINKSVLVSYNPEKKISTVISFKWKEQILEFEQSEELSDSLKS